MKGVGKVECRNRIQCLKWQGCFGSASRLDQGSSVDAGSQEAAVELAVCKLGIDCIDSTLLTVTHNYNNVEPMSLYKQA
jgi:hypothetical protein